MSCIITASWHALDPTDTPSRHTPDLCASPYRYGAHSTHPHDTPSRHAPHLTDRPPPAHTAPWRSQGIPWPPPYGILTTPTHGIPPTPPHGTPPTCAHSPMDSLASSTARSRSVFKIEFSRRAPGSDSSSVTE